MNQILNDIAMYGVLPVINVSNPDWASPLADALVKGGMPIIEVTLRADKSFESLKRIAYDGRLVAGAGTVTTIEQLHHSIDCGAQFIVSPGYSQKLIDECARLNIPIVPGCVDASTIQMAQENGLQVVKFFPSEQIGGINTIKALHGPFPNMKFVPTSGISFENLEKYLSQPFIAACGGSFMATAEQLAKEDFSGIEVSCRKAMHISLGFKIDHIGINYSNDDELDYAAQRFESLFGLKSYKYSECLLSGNVIENIKASVQERKGHIAFSVLSIERAMAWFARTGAKVSQISQQYDEERKIKCFYLDEDIGGFTLQIIER